MTPGIREDPVGWALLSRESGEVVVWQAPNLPSLLSQAAAVATVVAPRGSRLRSAAGLATVVASTWWGTDELARGVNPFRRSLGAAALVVTAVGVGAALRRR
ncbi:hypothetical protein GCM10023168_07140 [Fodinibacter luteus]|uniref:Uncharacterized protein n=1 Tax=Fodinibacter luteus TaxID=552064 RepID=A0ABP8K321_9MICO